MDTSLELLPSHKSMSRSSRGDDSNRTSESNELVINEYNGLKKEAPTRPLPKIRRHRPNPPTLFPIQVDPYCNDLRSTTRHEMNDNSCAIEPPLILPTKMSPHFLRTLTLRSNDSNEIITDTNIGTDDGKLIAQDIDIFSPYLSEPSEIYGDLCRVSFQLSPDDGDTKKPASSINQQFVYSSPSHIARHQLPYPAPRQRQNSSRSLFDMSNDPPVSSITIKPQSNSQQTAYSSLSHIARHHLPYPAPRQRQNSSRSLFNTSNDPLEWILRADAIAEAERMNEPLTDDEEEDNDNEGVDANFFLRLPSVDETNNIVVRYDHSCLLEEDKGSFKTSINVQQEAQLSSPYRFNTPPPRNVSNDSCLKEDRSASKMSISVPQEAYLSKSCLKTPPPSTI